MAIQRTRNFKRSTAYNRVVWNRWWKRVGEVPEIRAKQMVHGIRSRAKSRNIEFNLRPEDILPLPEVCPLLGLDLVYETGTGKGFKDNQPSIDRVDNSKGYVRGNVWVTSNRANSIKRNATLEELKTLVSCWEAVESLRAKGREPFKLASTRCVR